MDKKARNYVSFIGTIEREPKVFSGEKPLVSLFLKGDTERGNIHISAVARGELAQKLLLKAGSWGVGDEIYVEGELDWESYKTNSDEKKYQTVISAKNIYRIEGV